MIRCLDFYFFLRISISFVWISNFISFDKRNINYFIEQQKCQGHEKHDRLLLSKQDFNFRSPSDIENKPIDRVFFSNWVNYIKKMVDHILFALEIQIVFRPYIFFFEIRKLTFFQKKVFFSISLRSLTLFQLSVGNIFLFYSLITYF